MTDKRDEIRKDGRLTDDVTAPMDFSDALEQLQAQEEAIEHGRVKLSKKSRKSSRKKKLKRLLLALPVVLILCAGIAAGYWYWTTTDARKNVGITDDLKEAAVEDPLVNGQPSDRLDPKNQLDPNLMRNINFDKLLAKNDQLTRWLYVPNTNIDFHVVQEKEVNKAYYLWRDIYGNKNDVGTAFAPAVPGGGTSANQFVFAHRMYRAMTPVVFSHIHKYYATKDEAMKREYAYVYTPNEACRYRLWGRFDIRADNDAYNIPYEKGSDEYMMMLNQLTPSAVYETNFRPLASDDTLMLSTCRGEVGGKDRLLLVFVKDQVFNRKTKNLDYSRYRDQPQ